MDINFKEKYIEQLKDKKTNGLIGIWICGFGVIIMIAAFISSIVMDNFSWDWVSGIVLITGTWYLFGYKRYKEAKDELKRIERRVI